MVWPFVVQVVCVGLGVVLVARIATPRGGVRGVPDTHVRRDIADGLRWIRGHAPVRTLALVIFAFNITWGAAWSVLVLYSLDRLHMGEVGFGLLTTAAAAGGLVSTASYGWLERRIPLATVMRGCLLLEVLTHLALALTTVGWLAIAIMVVFGGYAFVWGTVSQAVRQRAVPQEFQGRVGSVYVVGPVPRARRRPGAGRSHRRAVGARGAVLVRLRRFRDHPGPGLAPARPHRARRRGPRLGRATRPRRPGRAPGRHAAYARAHGPTTRQTLPGPVRHHDLRRDDGAGHRARRRQPRAGLPRHRRPAARCSRRPRRRSTADATSTRRARVSRSCSTADRRAPVAVLRARPSTRAPRCWSPSAPPRRSPRPSSRCASRATRW